MLSVVNKTILFLLIFFASCTILLGWHSYNLNKKIDTLISTIEKNNKAVLGVESIKTPKSVYDEYLSNKAYFEKICEENTYK